MGLKTFRETGVMTEIPIIKHRMVSLRIYHKVGKTRVSVFKTEFPQLEVA
jgi:hypothetical protein